MDAECAVLDAGYRADEFNALPEISGGALLADRFQKRSDVYGVSVYFFTLAFSCLIRSLYASTRVSYISQKLIQKMSKLQTLKK